MNIITITLKRRTVLGELRQQCEAVGTVPVYINDTNDEPIGTVEDSADKYADALSFQLPDHICKKLSTNSYNIGVDYDYVGKGKDRIKINHIILAVKQGSEPIPRRNDSFARAEAAATVTSG